MHIIIGLVIGVAMLWLWQNGRGVGRLAVIVIFGGIAMGAGAQINQTNTHPVTEVASAERSVPCNAETRKLMDAFTWALVCAKD